MTILEFYKENITNQEGLYYSDIIRFTDEQLEDNHCYIQWLFPLIEPSLAVTGSPVLEDDDIEAFTYDWDNIVELEQIAELRERLLTAFIKMISFYGFKFSLSQKNEDDFIKVKIIRDPLTFEQKSSNWLTTRNHNFLRISRILASLRLLGQSSTAVMFHKCLCDVYDEYEGVIGPLTKQYWDEAMEDITES